MPNLPLHSRLGDGECGVRNIFLLLLFCKWTELAGWGFGQCNWSTERGEKQVIKKAAVLCLSSLCVLWAKMTSNYCSAIWTVIKLGGFQIPGTCECPYLPEECPWPWGAERSSPGPDAEITAEIPVPAWVFENVGENLAFNELQGGITNPSRAGTCTYIYFCCSEYLALNASSVGGHQSHVKPLIWSQQDQVDFLLLRGLSHGKNREMKCLFRG